MKWMKTFEAWRRARRLESLTEQLREMDALIAWAQNRRFCVRELIAAHHRSEGGSTDR